MARAGERGGEGHAVAGEMAAPAHPRRAQPRRPTRQRHPRRRSAPTPLLLQPLRLLPFLLLLPLLLAAAATAGPTAPSSFRARFASAMRLQRGGADAKAAALWAELAAERPHSWATLSNYAAALQGLDRGAEAVLVYRRAVAGNPAHPRLRINLALALEKTGDPKTALAELDVARMLMLQKVHGADPEAFASCLTNAASIASSYQLWPRDEIERVYLSALALVPHHTESQQNLLLFQRQADLARKKANRTASTATAACCSRSLRDRLCQTLGELAAYVHPQEMPCTPSGSNDGTSDGDARGDIDSDNSDGNDDFARPHHDDVLIAQRLACGSTNKSAGFQAGPVTRHVERALNCEVCAASREGRILQTVVDALRHREILVSAADTILQLFNTPKDLPWHMSLSAEKRTHLRQVIEEAVNLHTLSRPHKHVELGGYLGLSAIAVASMPDHIKVLSIERNPIYAAYARAMVHDLAEIPTSRVSILVGDSHRVDGPIDSVLLDHWKNAYLSDLQRLLPQFAQTTVVVADNTISPGVPAAYIRFVRARATRSYHIDTWLEQSLKTVRDGMEVSWFGSAWVRKET